jgi:hypothetical protein
METPQPVSVMTLNGFKTFNQTVIVPLSIEGYDTKEFRCFVSVEPLPACEILLSWFDIKTSNGMSIFSLVGDTSAYTLPKHKDSQHPK